MRQSLNLKSMRYIISLLILLSNVCLYGQSLKINVRDNQGALSFASIYINQDLCCIADINGIALISFDKLNYGDTITSTYLGMKAASIIFNKEIHDLSKCTIILEDDKVYELNPVIIKAYDKNGWKFFRKHTKTYNSCIFTSCIIRGNFKAEVCLSQDAIFHNVEGTFEMSNKNPPKKSPDDFFNYYLPPLPKIKTIATVNEDVKNNIIYSIRVSFINFCRTISTINREHSTTSKYSKVSYLGLNNNCHFYRLVYIDNLSKNTTSFQILFSVNEDTQEIETIESYTPLSVLNGSHDRKKLLSAGCRNLVYRKGKNDIVITIPVVIEYNVKMRYSSAINLILSDFTFQID